MASDDGAVWRSTNELIGSDGRPQEPTPAVRGALDRKTNLVAAKVTPVLESLLELVLADSMAASPKVPDPSDPEALFAFLEERCGDSASPEDFAVAEDGDDAGEGMSKPRAGVCAEMGSGVDDVDAGAAAAAMGPFMRKVIEAAVVRSAAEEPEDAQAWLKSFFADCKARAAEGELDEFLGFEFRPHAPRTARRG